MVHVSFCRCHTVTHGVTAVTAGAPWRLVRPKLRDNHRILWLCHQVPYINYLPWPGDQPGRPSWPWKCAYVRSTDMPCGRVRVLRGGIGGKLQCDFFVLSVPARCGCRTLFYDYTHSSQPIGAARLRPRSSGAKSEQSLPSQACKLQQATNV